VDERTEEAVVAYAVDQPTHRQVRASSELRLRASTFSDQAQTSEPYTESQKLPERQFAHPLRAVANAICTRWC
jgi:hypothetical protein